MRSPGLSTLGLSFLLTLSLGLSHTIGSTTTLAGSSSKNVAARGQHPLRESVSSQIPSDDHHPTTLQMRHLRTFKNPPLPKSAPILLLDDWEPCESSSQCSNGCCSSSHDHSNTDSHPLCIPLIGGFRSDFCLEQNSKSVTTMSTTISTGTCGNGNIGNGICADGTCCSDSGWCGTTVQHCASITSGRSLQSSSSMGTCGNGLRGDGICADGTCCSQFGWCGVNATDCSSMGPSFSLPPGELCTVNSQCMSGSCCFFDRGQNGPIFRCSSTTCSDNNMHRGSHSNSDTRDQADFARRDQPPPKILPVYYIVAIGVILILLLVIIIFLLIRKRRISSAAKQAEGPSTEKPAAPRHHETTIAMVRPSLKMELQSIERQPELQSSRQPTLPTTITISTTQRAKATKPSKQGQLVYPVVDPSVSDQSSYTSPSFPTTTTADHRRPFPSSKHPRSIMSEPESSIDEYSNL